MNKSTFQSLFAGLLMMAQSATATVNADSAANYGGSWTNGSNGGGGFGAWSITANPGSGWAGNGIWASTNAGLSLGDAFGYVAKGDSSYINMDRAFLSPMGTGDVFSLDLGLNYDSGAGGNKGFVLRTADNREIVTVNQAGSQVITVNGSSALTNYGTTTMHWTFTQKNATQMQVYATGRSGAEAYSATVNSSTPSFISNIHFYASAITNDAYAEYRQVYFDNLSLSQGASDTNVFQYAIEDSRATITCIVESASGDIVVPSTLGGYPVTAVGRAACKDRTNITSVSFAAGGIVTNIGASAFQGCTRMTSFAVPTALQSIPVAMLYGSTGLVSVTIPSGVTSIWDTAFANCRSLASLTLPDDLAFIGESAFLNCRSLTTIDIPSEITSVAGQLCYENRALTYAGIPAGVTNIGYSAFYNCFGLRSVTNNCPLKSVGSYAFSGCTNLETFYFYGGVSNLGEGVFYGCSGLEGVYFVCGVPSLGSDAGTNLFVGAANVTAYYLSNSTNWGEVFCGVDAEAWRPVITEPAVQAGAFNLVVDWANGQTVKMQACTNLLAPVWANIVTSTIANGSCAMNDANWASYSQRYYRITSTN